MRCDRDTYGTTGNAALRDVGLPVGRYAKAEAPPELYQDDGDAVENFTKYRNIFKKQAPSRRQPATSGGESRPERQAKQQFTEAAKLALAGDPNAESKAREAYAEVQAARAALAALDAEGDA